MIRHSVIDGLESFRAANRYDFVEDLQTIKLEL